MSNRVLGSERSSSSARSAAASPTTPCSPSSAAGASTASAQSPALQAIMTRSLAQQGASPAYSRSTSASGTIGDRRLCRVRGAAPPQVNGRLRKRAGTGFRERWVTREFILRCGCLRWLSGAAAQHEDDQLSAAALAGSSFINFSRTLCEIVAGKSDLDIVVRPADGSSWSSEDRHGRVSTARPLILRAGDSATRAVWLEALSRHAAYAWTDVSSNSSGCFSVKRLAADPWSGMVSSAVSSSGGGEVLVLMEAGGDEENHERWDGQFSGPGDGGAAPGAVARDEEVSVGCSADAFDPCLASSPAGDLECRWSSAGCVGFFTARL